MFKVLSHNDLTKRGGERLTTFVNMINDGKHFITEKGLVVLDKTQTVNGIKVDTHQLLALMHKSGFSAEFTGVTDKNQKVKVTYPKQFFKSTEFGGKGIGSGTTAEDAALTSFRKVLEEVMATTGEPYVPIKINGRVVNAVGVESTPGTPKSDFHVLDASGKEALWISHKDGSSAKDFQQWGGLTELDKKFPNHREIKKFIDDVLEKSGGELTGEASYARPIKDQALILCAVYGVDYATKRPGRQNVDVLLQGPVKLKKVGNYYEFTSNHTTYNGEIPTGDYSAQFFVRKGDRSNFGIKNGRFMVAPKALRRKSTIDI